jgi:hypothetical protein
MAETHYIEIDEEIIGAVGRLRKSSATENIFVFPKRALILQSIINLKLLGREAEKLGKSITVMSQDEQGMRLAEKAGLRIEEYHDTVLREHRQESDVRFTVKHGENIPMPEKPASEGLRRSTEIGSSSFYAHQASALPLPEKREEIPLAVSQSAAPVLPQQSDLRSLRVRNMSPPPQTALNSKRDSRPLPANPSPLPNRMDTVAPSAVSDVRKEKLRRLFQQPAEPSAVSPRPLPPRLPESSSSQSRSHESSSQRRSWVWAVVSLSIVVAVVLGGYFFLRPEAIVSVESQAASQMVRLSLFGTADQNSGEESVSVRFINEEKTIRLTRPATGKDLGNAAKAGGMITIINNHSDATQSLVATTRFETSDGKIYRLVEGVTVPGIKNEGGKKIPGKTDARVIADATGMSFNIASGAFKIPGFKGGPKYDSITAEVKSAFIGGGDGTGGNALSIAAADLDSAKDTAAEEAKQAVFSSLRSNLASGEAILEKSFQTAVVGTPVVPSIGTVVQAGFEYEARFQVRGFVISEAGLRGILDQETIESAGVVLKPHSYEIGYGTVLSNFETKRVDFTVESKVFFQAPLNEEKLKEELLGLDEEGIRNFLGTHPEIKRLQVEFKPKVFIATIPEDPNRVVVQFRPPESE